MKSVLNNYYVSYTLSALGIGNIPQELCIVKDILAAILGINLRSISSTNNAKDLGSFKISLEAHAHAHFYLRKEANAHCCSWKGWQKNTKTIEGKTYTGICRDWQVFSWFIRIWLVAGLQLCFSGSFLGYKTCRVFNTPSFGCKTWNTGHWGDNSSTSTWSRIYKRDWTHGTWYHRTWSPNPNRPKAVTHGHNYICAFGTTRRIKRWSKKHCRFYALGDSLSEFRRGSTAKVTIPYVSIDLCYWPTVAISCTSAGQAEIGQMVMEVLSNVILAYLNLLMAAGAGALGLNAPFYFECFGPVISSSWGTRALSKCTTSGGWSDVLMFRLEVLSQGNQFKDDLFIHQRFDKNGNWKGKCVTRHINTYRIIWGSYGNSERALSTAANGKATFSTRVFKCLNSTCNNAGTYIGSGAWSYWLSTWSNSRRHSWSSYDPIGWTAGK